MDLSLKEEALLCNFEDNLDVGDLPTYIQKLWLGELRQIIPADFKFEQDSEDKNEEIFVSGIACLLAFTQANFTGPNLPENVECFDNLKLPFTNFKKVLSLDGEDVSRPIRCPRLLVAAKYIFENSNIQNIYLKAWWCLRYAIIHQHFLDDYAPTLLTSIEEKLDVLKEWNLRNTLKAKLYLEVVQMYLLYNRIHSAEDYLEKAKDLLELKYELSGELGKRTKFQENETAQILLRVHLSNNRSSSEVRDIMVPEEVKLDDDVRFDSIQYSNKQNVKSLSLIEQCILLTTVQYMQKSRPRDDLLAEESESFITYLLQQKSSWTIHLVTLFLRCNLESNHKRTIERSLRQCESLIKDINYLKPEFSCRVSLTWSTGLTPSWRIEEQMANIMLSLGMVKSALEKYMYVKRWDEVIACYTILNERHKAIKIIKDQLEKDEELAVKWWCLLGDATDDISCYEKAWALSGQKSSLAQKHWGNNLYFSRKYAECIPHFQKSLDINSLQNFIWLRLGYAALCVEDWKLAASCYHRYTSLEPHSFEAWNNLGRAYVKLGEKSKAYFAFQEALKYSFDNWKVWDNFMIVSASTGHFLDVIRSYHKILDLKQKHLDLEVLFLILKSLLTTENKNDSTKLLSKTRELFGRLTSIYPNESELWEMYSDIAPSPDLKAQRLFRAYRGLVQCDWSKDPSKCVKVLDICQRLGEASLKAGATSISSTRLTLKSAVNAAKKYSWEEAQPILEKVEELLKKL